MVLRSDSCDPTISLKIMNIPNGGCLRPLLAVVVCMASAQGHRAVLRTFTTSGGQATYYPPAPPHGHGAIEQPYEQLPNLAVERYDPQGLAHGPIERYDPHHMVSDRFEHDFAQQRRLADDKSLSNSQTLVVGKSRRQFQAEALLRAEMDDAVRAADSWGYFDEMPAASKRRAGKNFKNSRKAAASCGSPDPQQVPSVRVFSRFMEDEALQDDVSRAAGAARARSSGPPPQPLQDGAMRTTPLQNEWNHALVPAFGGDSQAPSLAATLSRRDATELGEDGGGEEWSRFPRWTKADKWETVDFKTKRRAALAALPQPLNDVWFVYWGMDSWAMAQGDSQRDDIGLSSLTLPLRGSSAEEGHRTETSNSSDASSSGVSPTLFRRLLQDQHPRPAPSSSSSNDRAPLGTPARKITLHDLPGALFQNYLDSDERSRLLPPGQCGALWYVPRRCTEFMCTSGHHRIQILPRFQHIYFDIGTWTPFPGPFSERSTRGELSFDKMMDCLAVHGKIHLPVDTHTLWKWMQSTGGMKSREEREVLYADKLALFEEAEKFAHEIEVQHPELRCEVSSHFGFWNSGESVTYSRYNTHVQREDGQEEVLRPQIVDVMCERRRLGGEEEL